MFGQNLNSRSDRELFSALLYNHNYISMIEMSKISERYRQPYNNTVIIIMTSINVRQSISPDVFHQNAQRTLFCLLLFIYYFVQILRVCLSTYSILGFSSLRLLLCMSITNVFLFYLSLLIERSFQYVKQANWHTPNNVKKKLLMPDLMTKLTDSNNICRLTRYAERGWIVPDFSFPHLISSTSTRDGDPPGGNRQNCQSTTREKKSVRLN